MLFVEVLEDEEPQIAATRASLSADAASCSATLKRVQSTSWPSGLNTVSSHCADSVQSMTTGSRFVAFLVDGSTQSLPVWRSALLT